MSVTSSVVSALDQLIERYQQVYAEHGAALVTEAHDEWQAPIYTQRIDEDTMQWQPVRQAQPMQFSDLANALEQPFHADISDLYGTWFAADLNVSFADHPLVLLQVHGTEDGERLQANLAGHVLMKRRLRQPITLFIGLAEESDDLLITLNNETGQVGLEFVGREQHEILADSVAEFLQKLVPRVVD